MKKMLLMALLVLGTGKLFAQIITVKETSYDANKTLNFSKHPIVDINGKLTVAIDKPQLLVGLPQSQKSNPVMTAKLKALLFILQTQQSILTQLTPAVVGPVDKKKLAALSGLMLTFISRVQQYPDIRQDVNRLAYEAKVKYANHTLDTVAYPTLPTYVIKNLAMVTDTLVKGIQQNSDVSSILVQLEAFLNTKAENNRKIHVENFDNYSAGEYYEVPRWVTSFSQADVAQFNQVAQVSATLNTLINSKLSDVIKKAADSLKTYQCFSTLLSNVETQQAALTAQATADASTFINGTETDVKKLVAAMQAVLNLKNSTDANTVLQFNQVISNFLTIAKNFKTDIATLQTQVSAADQTVKTLSTQLNGCLKDLQADIDNITYLYNIATGILNPFQATANAAQQVTGSVYALTLDKLPALGYIDLKTTGRRENGDELVVKVIFRTKDDVDKNLPGTTLESETIQLQQVNFYSESNISVILAKPFHSNSQVTLGNKFQFAPGGSLLLKFGSRKSQLWNDISPGFGFNVSTPDFNLDGSPDVSYGGVVTLFKNVLSMGLAYNTKTSSPFWFFGLSLPFATLGLPLGNVQTQKN
jgi:hypothetical protein